MSSLELKDRIMLDMIKHHIHDEEEYNEVRKYIESNIEIKQSMIRQNSLLREKWGSLNKQNEKLENTIDNLQKRNMYLEDTLRCNNVKFEDETRNIYTLDLEIF